MTRADQRALARDAEALRELEDEAPITIVWRALPVGGKPSSRRPSKPLMDHATMKRGENVRALCGRDVRTTDDQWNEDTVQRPCRSCAFAVKILRSGEAIE